MPSSPDFTSGALESSCDQKCSYRDVSNAGKAAEVSWLRMNVMGPDQAVWALRITATTRYSDRHWSWGWGEPLYRVGKRRQSPSTGLERCNESEIVREGPNDTLI
jgi:hypothetical protein